MRQKEDKLGSTGDKQGTHIKARPKRDKPSRREILKAEGRQVRLMGDKQS